MASAREEQRKQVEALLGKSNVLPKNFSKTGPTDASALQNSRICRSFLCGRCPYDMLDNTKENIGRCPKIHLEKYKIIYETLSASEQEKYLVQYMEDLEYFVNACDKRVAVAQERLDYSEQDKLILEDMARRVEEYDAMINIILKEYQAVGNDIEKRIELTEQLQNLIIEKDRISRTYSMTLERLNTTGEQKLQVCKICGAYMLKNDTDGRLVDHYMGKIHLAYSDMRSSLDLLKNKFK
ncbi:hypothetical protein CANINC_000217 [Pichia inconspicua]|uniref:Uncharacterized protein n=1 Tax=Pichia inconspicua TaxID=52247 RepID=A0A4V4NG99_9ASCO|nr:hypothetical protein CANINC_000217 [[Candida] inconspicua]